MKFFLLFFLLFFVSPSWSASFDWTGWTRVESYYQNTSNKHNYYGTYHLMLQPSLHITDGLSLTSRFELSSLGAESLFAPSLSHRQTGLVFIYGEDSEQRQLNPGDLFLKLSQVYIDYETEFLRLRLGRAPFHFGKGLVYQATANPFAHFLNTHNLLSLYLKHSQFYFQPSLLHLAHGYMPAESSQTDSSEESSDSILGIAQGGLEQENWKVEVLYQHSLKEGLADNLAEVFGQYSADHWDLEAGLSYVFQDDTKMALALSGNMDIPLAFPVRFELKALSLTGDFSLNPAYTLALIYGNRLMSSSGESKALQVRTARLTDGIYSSGSLLFSFFNEKLQIRPLLFIGRNSETEKLSYEFDLEGNYQLEENLFASLKGGVLKMEEDLHLGLLAQVAVSF